MGKRSRKYARRKQDAYDTPREAVLPLVAHLPRRRRPVRYAEPCAGCGDLVSALADLWDAGLCAVQSDIAPRGTAISCADALSITDADLDGVDMIITNPPWTRAILHPVIAHFAQLRPTWLLFDADWMHTVQAGPYLAMCSKVVSAGRVSWMQNGVSGLDNCAWYLFDAYDPAPTRFFGWAGRADKSTGVAA